MLKDSRHPCLEMQDEVAFIANGISLIRGESEIHSIALCLGEV